MKKLLTLLLLLPLFSAGQFVIWNNELWFKNSPTDSTLYGPSYLQTMIEVIKGRFDNVETNKLNVNGSGSQLTGITASQVSTPEGTIGVPFYRRVSGSNATTTGQVLVDIAGLSIPLAASAVYEIEINISASTSNVTTGIQYAVNYTVAGGAFEGMIQGASSTTASKSERISVLNTATTAFLATSNQHGGIRITGSIITGANAGDFRVRHVKPTSGTSTVFINSFLKATRIQ